MFCKQFNYVAYFSYHCLLLHCQDSNKNFHWYLQCHKIWKCSQKNKYTNLHSFQGACTCSSTNIYKNHFFIPNVTDQNVFCVNMFLSFHRYDACIFAKNIHLKNIMWVTSSLELLITTWTSKSHVSLCQLCGEPLAEMTTSIVTKIFTSVFTSLAVNLSISDKVCCP